MPQDDYNYPKDEFDQLGANRAPQAVHRAPRPWWRVWGPLIVVIVLVPILAFAVIRAITADGDADEQATSTASATATEEPTPEDSGEESEEPTPQDSAEATPETPESPEEPTPEESTEEPTPEAPLDYAASVSVLNGAGVSGLAGRTQERLAGVGWTAVEAGNYQSAQPEVSTVYYANADLADEAQAIADELGITPVSELGDIASITVVLRSDFSE